MGDILTNKVPTTLLGHTIRGQSPATVIQDIGTGFTDPGGILGQLTRFATTAAALQGGPGAFQSVYKGWEDLDKRTQAILADPYTYDLANRMPISEVERIRGVRLPTKRLDMGGGDYFTVPNLPPSHPEELLKYKTYQGRMAAAEREPSPVGKQRALETGVGTEGSWQEMMNALQRMGFDPKTEVIGMDYANGKFGFSKRKRASGLLTKEEIAEQAGLLPSQLGAYLGAPVAFQADGTPLYKFNVYNRPQYHMGLDETIIRGIATEHNIPLQDAALMWLQAQYDARGTGGGGGGFPGRRETLYQQLLAANDDMPFTPEETIAVEDAIAQSKAGFPEAASAVQALFTKFRAKSLTRVKEFAGSLEPGQKFTAAQVEVMLPSFYREVQKNGGVASRELRNAVAEILSKSTMPTAQKLDIIRSLFQTESDMEFVLRASGIPAPSETPGPQRKSMFR